LSIFLVLLGFQKYLYAFFCGSWEKKSAGPRL
jgi:hypothetical protein